MGIELVEQARQFQLPKLVVVGTICAYPNSHPSRSSRKTCGTAIPRKPMRPTASPRRRSWFNVRPTVRNTV
jgi:hypothetical protein